ncbi:hypothetical protein [Xanthomonas sacchari]|uniref:hypothetical protein n=1 Tax=Xanthomonas sacchari TaxID=56458 RepID=UPI00225930CD|nr:hypothetical protein [Xanthomonas sacchari]UYK72818.1 hypothetical protein NG828_00225 [Xanthomonas sacchari]
MALFAMWLSALFYFKATETSNTFYDNTYKFTRDIAQLLAKMESGFGERLRNLDEGYASMRSYFQTGSKPNNPEELERIKQKLEDEKEELRKTIEARNKIVQDLLERSQLQAGEKEQITEQLKEKEKELEAAQLEISKINRKILMDKVRSKVSSSSGELSNNEGMNSFALSQVVEKIGRNAILQLSPVGVRRRFEEISKKLPHRFIEDLRENGLYEDVLTQEGIAYLKTLAGRGTL